MEIEAKSSGSVQFFVGQSLWPGKSSLDWFGQVGRLAAEMSPGGEAQLLTQFWLTQFWLQTCRKSGLTIMQFCE